MIGGNIMQKAILTLEKKRIYLQLIVKKAKLIPDPIDEIKNKIIEYEKEISELLKAEEILLNYKEENNQNK